MDAEKDFEARREELMLMRSLGKAEVTDDAVLHSFEDSVLNHDGFVKRYLMEAQMAAHIGNTLFVHGASMTLLR